MRFLSRFSSMSFLAVIRTAFFAIGVLTCVLVLVGSLSAMRGKEGLRRVYEEKMVPTTHLNEMQGPVRDIFFRLTAVMAKQLPAAGSKVKLEDAEAEVKSHWKEFLGKSSTLSPDESKLVSEISEGLRTFEAFTAALKNAYDANDHGRLESLFENEIPNVQTSFLNPVAKLAALKSLAVRAEYEYTTAFAQTAMLAMGALIIVVFVVFGASYWITYGMAGSLFSHTLSVADAAGAIEVSSNTLAKDAKSLREASTEQASTLEETSVSVNQLANAVGKNAAAAKDALRMVQKCDTLAAESGQSMERLLKAFEAIRTGTERTRAGAADSARRVTEILKLIEEIGRKTKVVHDIAFQTKMLSFNASIEAARAGEHGLGFSVVADEVGNLARRSADASKEIHTLLTANATRVSEIVRELTDQVDSQAKEGAIQVQLGLRVAGECSKSMGDVVQNVRAMVHMAAEISSSSQEQATGIEQMNKALQEINQLTQTNASVAQSAAGQSEVLLSRSEQLGSMVDQMQALIASGRSQSALAAPCAAAPQKENEKEAS